MLELSDQQRRKMADLRPTFAAQRMVDATELEMEIDFSCTTCGATESPHDFVP